MTPPPLASAKRQVEEIKHTCQSTMDLEYAAIVQENTFANFEFKYNTITKMILLAGGNSQDRLDETKIKPSRWPKNVFEDFFCKTLAGVIILHTERTKEELRIHVDNCVWISEVCDRFSHNTPWSDQDSSTTEAQRLTRVHCEMERAFNHRMSIISTNRLNSAMKIHLMSIQLKMNDLRGKKELLTSQLANVP